jgi:CO/xanthine dehydrogenase Mo-binding subunit
VVERIVDAAVDQLGLDPVEFQRQNLIRPDEFPYFIPTGNLYDSGNHPAVLDKALELLHRKGCRRKQVEVRPIAIALSRHCCGFDELEDDDFDLVI